MTILSSKNNTLLFIGRTCTSVNFTLRKRPETHKVFVLSFPLLCNKCYENMYGDRSHINPRNILITLFLEDILPLRTSDGECSCLSRVRVCFEGNRRGGRSDLSSPLFLPCRPKEGWTMKVELAGWKAVLTGCHLPVFYRWPMDKRRWLWDAYQFLGLT